MYLAYAAVATDTRKADIGVFYGTIKIALSSRM